MSFDIVFKYFGIPGIILFGLGTITCKLFQTYNIYIETIELLQNINQENVIGELDFNPQNIFNEIYENTEDVDETERWHNDFDTKTTKYGKKEKYKSKPVWKINLPPGNNGDVFIYRRFTKLDYYQYCQDGGKFFISVKIKNKKNTEISLQRKLFPGQPDDYSKYTEINKNIIYDGIHHFELKFIIGDEVENEEITKEQIGIHIKQSKNASIDNLIIEEAHIGEKKRRKFNILCTKYYLIFELK